MERRGFFKRFATAMTTIAIAPNLFANNDLTDNKNLNNSEFSLYSLTEEKAALLTEKFFEYLKKTKVPFKWERTNELKGVYSQKLRTKWTPELAQDISSCYSGLNSEKLNDDFFDSIIREMSKPIFNQDKTVYIHSLLLTPTYYSHDFIPFNGIIIRRYNA